MARNKDEILKLWIKQPLAKPLVQYLRDAEKISAWTFLGNKEKVLDIASESNVTLGIDAEYLVRVDASIEASAYSRKILKDKVNRFETINPKDPVLPFEDNTFDAAVSIGPYDWKFLDIEKITDELYRVVKENGMLIFSVPTIKSPYCTEKSKRMFRYYTVDELMNVIDHSKWFLKDFKLIFQPHRLFYFTPPIIQKYLVHICSLFSRVYTKRGLWNSASYIVVSLEKHDYKKYLDVAIECIFRPPKTNGFWDEKEGKIIRALNYKFIKEGKIVWSPDDSIKWRYAPFALMGIMQWRDSGISNDIYDSQIKLELNYFVEKVQDKQTLYQMPSYGIGPLILSFSLAYKVFQDESYKNIAWYLYNYSKDKFDFENSEDSLLLYGWSFLYGIDKDNNLLNEINRILDLIIKKQNNKGLFIFKNPTTKRHQNQMYTLWGIGKAIEVLNKKEYLKSIEDNLEYTIKNRMLDNGAFIWENFQPLAKPILKLVCKIKNGVPYWEFLFECHQTFFVNAVLHYYNAGGEKSYDKEIKRAMNWIFGNNVLNENLVKLSGIGVPMRMMTKKGGIDVEGQMFKGTYEIGSYIIALTNLTQLGKL